MRLYIRKMEQDIQEEVGTIAQLVSVGQQESFPGNKIQLKFPFNKSMMQLLIQILSSGDEQNYAGYKISSASLVIKDGQKTQTFLDKDSISALAYGLSKFYNYHYNIDYQWLRIRDPVEYEDEEGSRQIIIYFNFINKAEDKDKFFVAVSKQIAEDLKKGTEIEPVEDFSNFINEVIGDEISDIKDISKRRKKYYTDRDFVYDFGEDEAQEEEEQQQNDDEVQRRPLVEKRKRVKKVYVRERVLPKRTKRFLGKYGKGIDFDSINRHCINYHSLTGNINVYNNLQKIKKEFDRLRNNVAKKLHIG